MPSSPGESEGARRGSPHWVPYAMLTLVALSWAGNSVVGRALHESVPPVTLSFWRWCTALLILLPWVAVPLVRQWRVLAAHRGVLVLLSVLGVATYNTFNYLAGSEQANEKS